MVGVPLPPVVQELHSSSSYRLYRKEVMKGETVSGLQQAQQGQL